VSVELRVDRLDKSYRDGARGIEVRRGLELVVEAG